MCRSASSRLARILAAGFTAAAVAVPVAGGWGWADTGEAGAPPRPGGGAVRILIETIVVDGLGTNSVAEDEANLFPGQSGVVKKSITLRAREGSGGPDEQVDLTTRVALGDQAQSYCPIMLAIVATGTPRGGPAPTPAEADRKALSITLEAGETHLTQAYVSPWTRGRITLRITCGEVLPAVAAGAPRSIAFDISLQRGEDDAVPRLLRRDRLSTTLGGEAGSLFSSNMPLPDSADGERRYRRERLEVKVAPRILSGDRLQVEVRLRGEVATISASGTDERHPIDVEETLVLADGETDDLEVTVIGSAEEGWLRVRYLLRVTGRF